MSVSASFASCKSMGPWTMLWGSWTRRASIGTSPFYRGRGHDIWVDKFWFVSRIKGSSSFVDELSHSSGLRYSRSGCWDDECQRINGKATKARPWRREGSPLPFPRTWSRLGLAIGAWCKTNIPPLSTKSNEIADISRELYYIVWNINRSSWIYV